MKNVKIEVLIGRTINLGEYESLRVQAGLSFDIDQEAFSTKFANDYASAWEIVQNEVDIKSQELEKQLTNKTPRARRR